MTQLLAAWTQQLMYPRKCSENHAKPRQIRFQITNLIGESADAHQERRICGFSVLRVDRPWYISRTMSPPDDDFAALFEKSLKAKPVRRGETIEGTIVAINAKGAFVDVGGKGEAVVDLGELKNDDGALEVAVGDRIHAVVVSTSGGLTLSRRLARGAASDRQLAEAFQARLPVEGKVEREIKGGYEVRIGRQRAFCPISQIDNARTTDAAAHVGHVYAFRIVEYRESGRNIVVSRRALIAEEQQARAEEIRGSIVPGAVLKGRVVSVREFGAFVDLGGGIQGLLHVSDMAWSRLADAAQTVAAGDDITVKVLRVDEGTQRISLGVKQLGEDPWATAAETFAPGQVRMGRVTRVAEFGAFVELAPGIEGLAHASTFPPTGTSRGWTKTVPVGLAVAFEILTVDAPARRIGVALVPEGSTRQGNALPSGEIAPGARVTGKVERLEKFGVFVFLAPGRTGLMPLSETGVAREGDVAKAFPIGSDIEVVVLEIDPSGRRIRVSRKAVLDAQDADELRAYHERAESASPEGFGSLADKLRHAFETKKG
jgi:small subunit ribosomal protein S1